MRLKTAWKLKSREKINSLAGGYTMDCGIHHGHIVVSMP